jgi:hypothetical protein
MSDQMTDTVHFFFFIIPDVFILPHSGELEHLFYLVI